MKSSNEFTDNSKCFICGEDNPNSLMLKFTYNDNECYSIMTPEEKYQGFKGITHGGILAAVLDEVMAKAAINKGYCVATGELTVRYKSPAYIGREIKIVGRIDSKKGRKVFCSGEAIQDNKIVAESSAIMIEVA
ncbi:MAG: PaaI family thioesterase [Armatimonadota bacterium]